MMVRKKFLNRKRISLETYEPDFSRIDLNRGDAVPVLVRLGSIFLVLGGLISFVTSSFIIGVKGFFGIKKKVSDINILRREYIDIRK